MAQAGAKKEKTENVNEMKRPNKWLVNITLLQKIFFISWNHEQQLHKETFRGWQYALNNFLEKRTSGQHALTNARTHTYT